MPLGRLGHNRYVSPATPTSAGDILEQLETLLVPEIIDPAAGSMTEPSEYNCFGSDFGELAPGALHLGAMRQIVRNANNLKIGQEHIHTSAGSIRMHLSTFGFDDAMIMWWTMTLHVLRRTGMPFSPRMCALHHDDCTVGAGRCSP